MRLSISTETMMVGPAGFGPATNRSLSAPMGIYEPGALTGLSYGPVFCVPFIMLFLTKFKRFPHFQCTKSARAFGNDKAE